MKEKMSEHVILIVFSLTVLSGLYGLNENLWQDPVGAFFFAAISISVCVQVIRIIQKLKLKNGR